MKLTTKLIAGTAALAFLTMSAASLQATQVAVTNVINISILASAQGATNTIKNITTAKPPSKHQIATKDILSWLAVAENAAGNYRTGTNFPAGAKLVVITGNNADFQVLTKTNTLIVDVSNIISATNGANDIYSGKYNNSAPAPASTTDLQVLTFQYDDTAITGSVGVKFYMTGLMTSTTTDIAVKSKSKSVTTETQSSKLSSGVGEGTYQGHQFVLTGSFSASGKATLPTVN
jgi:hypothetical protein